SALVHLAQQERRCIDPKDGVLRLARPAGGAVHALLPSLQPVAVAASHLLDPAIGTRDEIVYRALEVCLGEEQRGHESGCALRDAEGGNERRYAAPLRVRFFHS